MWLLSLFIFSIFYSNINCSEDDENIKCADNTMCSKNSTCCPGKGDSYMCCPVENAVCCMDGEHCCPDNTRCDLRQMRCVGVTLKPVTDDFVRPALIELTKRAHNVNNDCHDHVHYCAGAETCCVSSGTPKCCPYPYGTCCADGLHCCPYGTACINNTICKQGSHDEGISALDTVSFGQQGSRDEDISALYTVSVGQQDVVCKDGRHCKGNATCCLSILGYWGCCPFENAVCCPDKLHCCPKQSICFLTIGGFYLCL